tara:strand:+ start:20 stop:214 length:195 start_codon:yes stop_codon:yes gene_type:complete
MALKLIVILVFFILFIITMMGIVIKIIKRNNRNNIIWNMEEMDKRDRVVTRTGGLENDRLNERQ